MQIARRFVTVDEADTSYFSVFSTHSIDP